MPQTNPNDSAPEEQKTQITADNITEYADGLYPTTEYENTVADGELSMFDPHIREIELPVFEHDILMVGVERFAIIYPNGEIEPTGRRIGHGYRSKVTENGADGLATLRTDEINLPNEIELDSQPRIRTAVEELLENNYAVAFNTEELEENTTVPL